MRRSKLRSKYARCAALATALPVALPALAVAQFAQSGQFALPAPTPPILRDRIASEWINLETELIEPIAWIAAGSGYSEMVAVANEPDDRVVFLDANLNFLGDTFVGQGPATLAKNPAAPELWVSVRNQSCVVVIDLRTRLVTNVLRRTVQPGEVGLGNAASPGGIAFSNGRAFVASSQTDELLVFDATTKAFVTAIPLEAIHHGQQVALNDPFGVTAFGGKIYVTSHLSGNNTTARIAGGFDIEDGDDTPTNPADDIGSDHLGPDDVSIAKLGQGAFASLALPDFDVAVVNPATHSVEGMIRGLGTILFDVEGDPLVQRLVVPNLESRNAEFIGESAFPEGRVVFNRMSWFDPATGALVGAPLVTESPGLATSIVMPTDAEITATGRLYVAGFCSSNVGIFAPNGTFQGAIATNSGPRGVTTNSAQTRLYVYCRGTHTVECWNSTNAVQLPAFLNSVALPDPTFTRVKEGRKLFLEPRSGSGTANCASCHIDGRVDGLGWDLSKTLAGDPTGENPIHFRDRKGVMVTQFLLGLAGSWPLHWRGEQEGVESFNGAFTELLHGDDLDPPQLALLTEYIESLQYPPNPRQSANREHSAASGAGFTAASGCVLCHFLPLGTSGDLTCSLIGDAVGVSCVESAQLRGLWLKESDEADIDPSAVVEHVRASGYGLLHEGVVDDLEQFLTEFFPLQAPSHAVLEAFVDELDAGLAPSTSYSEMLDRTTANTTRADAIELYLIPQAEASHCDLVARGQLDEGNGLTAVGLVWRRTTTTDAGQFESDDLNGATPVSWTFAQLESKAADGEARLLFCGVPLGSGDRMGVDRDRDGKFDRDETQAGTLPRDPDSDDDGWWDLDDSAPTTQGAGAPTVIPHVVPGSVRIVYVTTNAVKLSYETDALSPTIVRFGLTSAALPWSAGDGLQPIGSTTTNHWKRKHTVFLGPQPEASTPLPMLTPDHAYVVEILTQGQNSAAASWSSGVLTQADIAWQTGQAPIQQFRPLFNNALFLGEGSTFRVSELVLTPGSNSGGTWTYRAQAWIEETYGTVPQSLMVSGTNPVFVPAQLTLYDAMGGYVTETTKGTVELDPLTQRYVVHFLITLAAPNHQTGDRATIDLPMWAKVPLQGGVNVGFPVILDTNGTPVFTDDLLYIGNWSDSVTHDET